MLSAAAVIGALETARGDASGGDILRRAVGLIRESDGRFDWVGLYMLEGDTLVLSEYVGKKTEHDRIAVGVGVCGTAVAEGRDINVADVRAVENYLACSLETRAELVVLIRAPGDRRILGQLDLDSDRPGAFTDVDLEELRTIADWLGERLA